MVVDVMRSMLLLRHDWRVQARRPTHAYHIATTDDAREFVLNRTDFGIAIDEQPVGEVELADTLGTVSRPGPR